MALARAGSLLLVAAGVVVVAAIAMAFTGQAVGIGSRAPGGILVIALFTLLGLGSAALALGDSPPASRSRALRRSLGIFAVGALMESAAAIGLTVIETDGLASLPLVILMLGGGAVMLLGVAALAITGSIARRHS